MPPGNCKPEKGFAMVSDEHCKDVTEPYRTRYRGVVAAEKRSGEVLVLIDEGETYAVTRHVLAVTDNDREVVVRIFVDHVPKSHIETVLSGDRSSGGRRIQRFRPDAALPRLVRAGLPQR